MISSYYDGEPLQERIKALHSLNDPLAHTMLLVLLMGIKAQQHIRNVLTSIPYQLKLISSVNTF